MRWRVCVLVRVVVYARVRVLVWDGVCVCVCVGVCWDVVGYADGIVGVCVGM